MHQQVHEALAKQGLGSPQIHLASFIELCDDSLVGLSYEQDRLHELIKSHLASGDLLVDDVGAFARYLWRALATREVFIEARICKQLVEFMRFQGADVHTFAVLRKVHEEVFDLREDIRLVK